MGFQGRNNILFSSPLKRELLREKEHLLVKKHSRTSERELCIFGVPTQWKAIPTTSETADSSETQGNIKKALQGLVTQFSNVENSFIGRLPEEVIIDPIAVYLEL